MKTDFLSAGLNLDAIIQEKSQTRTRLWVML